jgi:hypothetical protein
MSTRGKVTTTRFSRFVGKDKKPHIFRGYEQKGQTYLVRSVKGTRRARRRA